MPDYCFLLQLCQPLVQYLHLIGKRDQQPLYYFHTRSRCLICIRICRRLSFDLGAKLRLVLNEMAVPEFEPTIGQSSGNVVPQFAEAMVVKLPDEALPSGQ